MHIERITEEALRQTLSSILAARSIDTSSLLDLDLVTRRLEGERQPARERERALVLAETLVRLARAKLLRLRAATPASGQAPEMDGDPRAALAFDFRWGNLEQEAWSCLYYRYLAAVTLPVQEIAAVAQPGSAHGRRLVSRRLARGYALMTQALQQMERQASEARAESPASPAATTVLAPTPSSTASSPAAAPDDPSAPARASGPARASARASIPSRPAHRLPRPIGRFIGRQAERAALRQQLGERRLITLLGPGGVGKTRLALELAVEVDAEAEGAACFVDLSAIDAGGQLPREVAGALGIRAAGGGEREAIIEVLWSRPWLLLLDNCEHLVEAAADEARRLLEAVPHLRILATSRQALGVPGEALYPLPPLGLAEDDADLARLAESEALQLFSDRARATRPGFALSADRLPLALSICRRLDGLPLAIELAAARLASMPLEEISRRLDQRFLQGAQGPRAGAARQRTLFSTIDWSHQLLSPAERRAFRRVSVFPGSFGREAALAVVADAPPSSTADSAPDSADPVAGTAADAETGDGGGKAAAAAIGPADFEDAVDRLVGRSLLQIDAEAGPARLRMLETIRAYAAERLREAGEAEAARDRLLDWALDGVERAAPALRGPEQVAWLDRIERDFESLGAAMDHALRQGDAPRLSQAARILIALDLFSLFRGHGARLSGWLAGLLEREAELAPALAARLRLAGAVIAIADKRSSDALELCASALPAFEALADDEGEQRSRYWMAVALHHLSRNEEARAQSEGALAYFREREDGRRIARALDLLSSIDCDEQRFESALARNAMALEILSEGGHPHEEAGAVTNQVIILRYMERAEEARALLEENLARYARIGSRPGVALTQANLGLVLEDLGRFGEAREVYARAERYYRDQGNVCTRALVLTNMVVLSCKEGSGGPALPQALDALRLALRCGTGRNITLALGVAGRCAFEAGRPRLAARLVGATRRGLEAMGSTESDVDFIRQQLPTGQSLEGRLGVDEASRWIDEGYSTDPALLIPERLARRG